MHVDLVDLGLFRHVVEAGSITHGAERAHLALAAASTRIRAMEEDVGAKLLVRSRTGVVPTKRCWSASRSRTSSKDDHASAWAFNCHPSTIQA